jgi:hypothetical protein
MQFEIVSLDTDDERVRAIALDAAARVHQRVPCRGDRFMYSPTADDDTVIQTATRFAAFIRSGE